MRKAYRGSWTPAIARGLAIVHEQGLGMPECVRTTTKKMGSLGDRVVALARTSLGATAFETQIFSFSGGASTPPHDEAPSG